MVNKMILFVITLILTICIGLIFPMHTPATTATTHLLKQAQLRQQHVFRRQLRFSIDLSTPSRFTVSYGVPEAECPYQGRDREHVSRYQADAIGMTVLQPILNRHIRIESTLATHPTVFLYIPPTWVTSAAFQFFDENDRSFEATIPLSAEGGVIGIRIPADTPALEINQTYDWSLMLNCDEYDPSGNPWVKGAIQRIELNSTQSRQLENMPPRDRPFFYAAAGIWTDTLTSLSELRLANPTDPELTQNWVDLLSSVPMYQLYAIEPLRPEQVQAIAQAPLLGITTYSGHQDN